MDDTAKNDIVKNTAGVIEEHKAREVVAIDLKDQNSWTDYFIIATVNSQGHMRGVLRSLRAYLNENNIEFNNKYKNVDDYSWLFVDCGFMVVHLMDEETRNFYDLENLWFNGKIVYSSKSS